MLGNINSRRRVTRWYAGFHFQFSRRGENSRSNVKHIHRQRIVNRSSTRRVRVSSITEDGLIRMRGGTVDAPAPAKDAMPELAAYYEQFVLGDDVIELYIGRGSPEADLCRRPTSSW
jgi:hypothetical protein